MDSASVLICQLLVISACICFVISENVNASCIRKCCKEGWILSLEAKGCISANADFEFSSYRNVCLEGFGKCGQSKVAVPIEEQYFEIENETLVYNFRNQTYVFNKQDFCVEYLDNISTITAIVCTGNPNNQTFEIIGEKNTTCCSKSSSSQASRNENFKNICPDGDICKNKIPFVLNSNHVSIENNFLEYLFDNKSVYFASDDFCIDELHSKHFEAVVCVEPPKYECITKCCSHASIYSNDIHQCIPMNQTFVLPYKNICHETRDYCNDGKVRAFIAPDILTVNSENNALVMTVGNTSVSFEKDYYCIDYLDDLNTIFGLVCYDNPYNVIAEKTALTGMIISMPFLLATFIAYALLPDRNLHMKALMMYVINLMLGYLLLVIIQLSNTRFSDDLCMSMGYFCLFFFLVSFFWMNVICIDIWFTFSGLRGFSGSKKTAERKRFLMYCVYAWGMPVLHVSLVRIIEASTSQTSLFKPGIGDGQCFLKRGYPELFYFYGPMAIIITINIVFFSITAYKIRTIKKDTSMLKKEDSKRHSYENDKQTFNLYLKLLFAMGVNWSMEIISWAVIWKIDQAPDAIWYLTDFCNAIYGVFIFFIFVFKRSIWKLLKKRYYSFIGKPHLAHSMTMTNTTRVTSYSTANSSIHDHPHGVNDTNTLNSEA